VFSRPPSADNAEKSVIDRRWFKEFLSRRRTWLAFGGVMLMWSWYYVLSGDAVGVLTVAGVPRRIAAGAFGLVGSVSIASRLASGELADRYGYRPIIIGAIGLATVGVLLLLAAGVRPVMYLSLVFFGVGLGGLAALYAPALIHAFDPNHPSAVVGTFQFANAVAGLFIPPLVATLVSRTGGYSMPLVLVAAMTALGAGPFWLGTDPGPDGDGVTVEAGGRSLPDDAKS